MSYKIEFYLPELSYSIGSALDKIKEFTEEKQVSILEEVRDFITLEIEFENLDEAQNFEAPSWFGEDVTMKPEYKNVNLTISQ